MPGSCVGYLFMFAASRGTYSMRDTTLVASKRSRLLILDRPFLSKCEAADARSPLPPTPEIMNVLPAATTALKQRVQRSVLISHIPTPPLRAVAGFTRNGPCSIAC